ELLALCQDHPASIIDELLRGGLPLSQGEEPPPGRLLDGRSYRVALLLLRAVLGLGEGLRPVAELHAPPGEDLDAADYAREGRAERAVAEALRWLPLDGPQQLLLGAELDLARGAALAHQDLAWLDLGAEERDPRGVEVADIL